MYSNHLQNLNKILSKLSISYWKFKWMMDDLQFDVLFNSISNISGRWTDDNERLFAWKFMYV